MLTNFLKGIVIGIGGIAPGLSGSVLLVIFGLYQKTISAINDIIRDFFTIVFALFKKDKEKSGLKDAWGSFVNNLLFLVPLFLGLGLGVILFGKIVDYLLTTYEMYTRFAFLGLILGTLPLFSREVKKEGFAPKYYVVIGAAALVGVTIFYLSGNLFPVLTEANFLQSMVMGFAYAGSAIVPGVDSAAIMSSLGLYELWLKATATVNLQILFPAVIGLGIGVIVISFIVNKLISKWYTMTFSVIMGLFLAIIPKVLNESCAVGWNVETLISAAVFVLGLLASLFFSNLEKLKEKAEQEKA